jgi:hypothetical protein
MLRVWALTFAGDDEKDWIVLALFINGVRGFKPDIRKSLVCDDGL